jgi:cysteine desulfurase
MMWENSETEKIFDVGEFAGEAHAAGALFHTDAVQAVGRLDIDLAAGAIDFLSLSGVKLHAPIGVGVLYIRHETPFAPLLLGGRQKRGRCASTENVPGIVEQLRHTAPPGRAGR